MQLYLLVAFLLAFVASVSATCEDIGSNKSKCLEADFNGKKCGYCFTVSTGKGLCYNFDDAVYLSNSSSFECEFPKTNVEATASSDCHSITNPEFCYNSSCNWCSTVYGWKCVTEQDRVDYKDYVWQCVKN